jgi:poly(A) polymerase
MTSPKTRAVLDALVAGDVRVRFVGGCVRDAVIGRKNADVDLATDARPERVMELLAAADLKVVATSSPLQTTGKPTPRGATSP